MKHVHALPIYVTLKRVLFNYNVSLYRFIHKKKWKRKWKQWPSSAQWFYTCSYYPSPRVRVLLAAFNLSGLEFFWKCLRHIEMPLAQADKNPCTLHCPSNKVYCFSHNERQVYWTFCFESIEWNGRTQWKSWRYLHFVV